MCAHIHSPQHATVPGQLEDVVRLVHDEEFNILITF
jgi:hypothetical protein